MTKKLFRIFALLVVLGGIAWGINSMLVHSPVRQQGSDASLIK